MKTTTAIASLGLAFMMTAGCVDQNSGVENSRPKPPTAEQVLEQTLDMAQPIDQAVITVSGAGSRSRYGVAVTQLDFKSNPINLATCKQIGADAYDTAYNTITCMNQGNRVAGFRKGKVLLPASP